MKATKTITGWVLYERALIKIAIDTNINGKKEKLYLFRCNTIIKAMKSLINVRNNGLQTCNKKKRCYVVEQRNKDMHNIMTKLGNQIILINSILIVIPEAVVELVEALSN